VAKVLMKPLMMFKIFSIRVFSLIKYSKESLSELHSDVYVKIPCWYLKNWTIPITTHRSGFFSRN
jgi:hypothetical protein